MLVQDLEKNIYEVGGRKVELCEMLKNDTYYFHQSLFNKYKYIDGIYKKTGQDKDITPAQFFYTFQDVEVAEEWTYLFYHIPVEKTAEEVKREKELGLRLTGVKQTIISCMTDDGENIIYSDAFYPDYFDEDRIKQIGNAVFNPKTELKTVEENIYACNGKNLEFGELSKNIREYIQNYYPWSYGLYCKNGYNRLKDMTEKELIYYLSEKDFLNEYTFKWYHIPFARTDKTKDTMFLYDNDKKLSGYDKNFVGVKEILVVTGTHDNKDLEFFKVFFPFDMLEEKQKKIKNFILNGNK